MKHWLHISMTVFSICPHLYDDPVKISSHFSKHEMFFPFSRANISYIFRCLLIFSSIIFVDVTPLESTSVSNSTGPKDDSLPTRPDVDVSIRDTFHHLYIIYSIVFLFFSRVYMWECTRGNHEFHGRASGQRNARTRACTVCVVAYPLTSNIFSCRILVFKFPLQDPLLFSSFVCECIPSIRISSLDEKKGNTEWACVCVYVVYCVRMGVFHRFLRLCVCVCVCSINCVIDWTIRSDEKRRHDLCSLEFVCVRLFYRCRPVA